MQIVINALRYLIELVINLPPIDTLSKQGPHGIPGNLLWRQVGATLWGGREN